MMQPNQVREYNKKGLKKKKHCSDFAFLICFSLVHQGPLGGTVLTSNNNRIVSSFIAMYFKNR